MGLRQLLRRFCQNEGGNFALLFSITLPVIIGTAALMVDEAMLHHERRVMQAAVDLAAIHAAGDPTNAAERTRLALVDAHLIDPARSLGEMESQGVRIEVQTGSYNGTDALATHERFTIGGNSPDAVRVTMRRPGSLYFYRSLFGPPDIAVSATAAASARAAFSVGSRLASLEGGLANSLLDGLLGISATAGVMGYDRLLGVDIAVADLLDALAGRLSLSAGTYDQLLSSEIALSELIAAAATVLDKDSQAAAVAAALVGAVAPQLRLRGNRLFGLGPLGSLGVGTDAAGLESRIGVIELLGAAASLANGRNQASLGFSLQVPGLLGTSLAIVVGEPPQGSGWFGIGREGTVVRTAQLRLRLLVTVAGTGLLQGTGIRLPIYLEAASAEARLTDLSCPPGRPQGATAVIAARPGIARAQIGEVSDAALTAMASPPTVSAARLVSVVNAVRITGSADVAAQSQSWTDLAFTTADVPAGTIRTASTRTATQSLTASLLENLEVEVTLLGLNLLNGLLRPAYESAVRLALAPVAPLVDGILNAAFDVTGLSLGEADVRVHGLACRHAVLVQ
ncbi:MAG: TadG family pilus assembly protein [Devosia sp.]